MKKARSTQLNCFSPLVMITTFLIETSAALYVLWRYKKDTVARLILAMLGCLSFFQLAEYMICEKAVLLSSLDWARLGYVAITLLPPLGIHLGSHIAHKKPGFLLKLAYANAAAFITFFLFIGNGMQGEKCLGNYIIFYIAPHAIIPYALYYYGWLITGVHLAWKARTSIQNPQRKQALKWLTIGYMSFLIPTFLANIIKPETISGIPSIMCGFAVILSFCLLFKVAPLILKENAPENLAQRT